MERFFEIWRLADDEAPHPGKLLKGPEELCRQRRYVDWCSGALREPVQIADVLFVGVSGHDLVNFGVCLLKVARERSTHLWRAGIDSDAVVNNRGAEEQRHSIGQSAI